MIDYFRVFKIRKTKMILVISLSLLLVAIFVLLWRVRDSKIKPQYLQKGQVQSIVMQESGKTEPQSTPMPVLSTPTPTSPEKNQPQPQSQESLTMSKFNLPDFERLSYQATGQTKEEFFARQKSLLGKIESLQFERITTIESGSQVTARAIYKYQIKNSKGRTEMPDSSIIITRSDGCFRHQPNSDVFYKYKEGGPEKNCRVHGSWSKYTAEEFEAMGDFKILGTGSFEGKSATVVQFLDSIANIQFILKAWVSNENGLTLLAGGKADDKKVTIEFKNYNFSEINDSVFEIPVEKVIETTELF
jgi:outer membrane lipoprotein-sorting protein